MGRIVHLQLDVKNALLHWKDHEWEGVLLQGGRKLSAMEAKAELLAKLADGVRFIPIGGPCDGFDPTGRGCPGHEHGEDIGS